MDEGDDSYVPQISQMDYSLLSGGPYFDQGDPANFQSAGQSAYAVAGPQHGQAAYGGAMMSQPGMPPPGYGVTGGMEHEAAYRMGMAPGPFPPAPSSLAGLHQQPHPSQMLSPKGKQRALGGGGGQPKQKGQRRGKKEKAADVPQDSAPMGSPMAQFAAPAQQPLPASFPNIPRSAVPSMSQQMMQQRQMQAGTSSMVAQHDPRGKFVPQQQPAWGYEPPPQSGMQRPNFDAFQQPQMQQPPQQQQQQYYGSPMGQGASYPQLQAGHPPTGQTRMDKPAPYYAQQQQQQLQPQQHHQYPQQPTGVQSYPSHQQDNNAPPAYPVPSGQQQQQQQQQASISGQQWMGHGRSGANGSSVGVQPSPHYPQFPPPGGMYQSHPAAMPTPQQQQQFRQTHCELGEVERQLSCFYQQPQRTPEMDMRMDQLYQHANYLRNRLLQMQKQIQAQSAMAAPSYPTQQRYPPSMPGSGGGTAMTHAAQTYPASSSVTISQPSSSSSLAPPPVPISSQASLQTSSMQATFASNQSAHISPNIPQSAAQAPYYHPQMVQPSQQQQQHPPSSAPTEAAPQPTAMRQENPMGGRGAATTKGASGAPVAVMQTGANQVQVNITPEAAGARTFISVYHQYPSQMSASSLQAQPTASSAHSSTYPSPSLSSKADSIPPEPLPPKTQQEQYRPYVGRGLTTSSTYGQQQKANAGHNVAPTTVTNPPPFTASIAPTPAPSAQREVVVTTSTRKEETFDYPAPPASIEVTAPLQQQQLQQTRPVANRGVEGTQLAVGPSSVEVPMPQAAAAAEVVEEDEERKPHARVRSDSPLESANSPEQLISQLPSPPQVAKIGEAGNSAEPAVMGDGGEDAPTAVEMVKGGGNCESASEGQPVGEQPMLVKAEEESSPRPDGVGGDGDGAGRREKVLPEGGASSSSVSAFAQAVKDAANDIQTDDGNETEAEVKLDEEVASTKEADEDPVVKIADDSEAAPKRGTKTAGRKRGRKPGKKSTAAGQTRKRKLHVDSEEDEYFDEKDTDFVVNKKTPKGGRKRKAPVEKVESIDDPDTTAASSKTSVDLEQFVEKRRSGRKRAEKKSYDEDSKVLDFEEELPLKGPSTSNNNREDVEDQVSPEAEPPKEEWTVEKILAIRLTKRKKKKVKENAPRSSLEEEAPEQEEAVIDAAADAIGEAPNVEKIDEPGEEKAADAEAHMEVENSELPTTVDAGVSKAEEGASANDGSVDAQSREADTATSNKDGGEGVADIAVTIEPTSQGEAEEDKWEDCEEEEVYVKFKGRSYLHCAWKFVDELEELDKRVVGKINRFKLKNGKDVALYDEDDDTEELFNEDYTVVDRVLDETYDETEKEHYALVKWRSLGYDECTWELFNHVPKDKIEECRKRNNVVDSCKAKERPRPRPEEWQHAKIPFDKSYKDGNQLRDYQVEGVNWLLFGYLNRQNCILADEMGLGKTVQTITFLQAVFDLGVHGPFLIVVPLSTLHNWEREFETWTYMNAIVYHGSVASRQMLQNYEFYYAQQRSEPRRRNPLVKFDVLITTFETIVNDCEVLRRIDYQVCVIDEAHRLKNRNCKLLTNGLAQFQLQHRVLLTGTPLQNSIHELFSLLNFLEPEQFHNSESFLQQFGQCQTEEQVQKLQEILKPMMLRRLKEDVEKNIPLKEETIIEVQLSNIQKKYYRAILERNFTHLLKGTSVPSLMNVMMELRKCCNHPFLIRGAEDQIVAEVESTMRPMAVEEKSEEDVQLHALIQSSGKMVLIDKLLPKLRQDGHKVLIFSQMVRVLDILEEFLNHRCYPYERIDGNIRGDMRQAAIDRFGKQDSERFVFLLCTRAGGLGINLTAADTVIIFDSDWNPQNDIQAQARCHRIGQTKMVKVYRLITAQTYEREMFDRASLKLGLDKAVLQSSTPRGDNNQQMSRKEVEDLLRKGAYGAVMDEDNEGSKFSEEDIETILQRRTRTIVLEPGIKGSTFAKASFKSSDNREDIDILDPEFWQKWAKKANIDMEKLAGSSTALQQHLIVSEPRSRRRRFEEQNYKTTESGEDGLESDDETGGGRKLAKSSTVAGESSRGGRSAKKRRRAAGTSNVADDDDEDYVHTYRPDELSFNKAEYFRVEKLLAAWGFGRWKWVKERSDITLTEEELEHVSRTLLLHCLREFRGDERTREFVWQLITPKGGTVGKAKKGAAVTPSTIYHEGWAASPEYNPPAFAVDSSFQRHIHRHSNKLMVRVQALEMLKQLVIGEREKDITELEKAHDEVQFQMPAIGDPPYKGWDMQCDKSFLMGVFKHGMDNFEAIRDDPKLCFVGKGMKEEMPTVLELNNRFKRLMTVLQRQAEYAANSAPIKSTKWTKAEEADFMRLLRTYGVKDSNSETVIDWTRFRELSTGLKKKSDEAMLEQLYCVLAMCTHQQGGDLSAVDKRRAASVEQISAKRAEKLMNRLHLMRKIHAIITTGIHNVRTSLKLCSSDVMPDGWTDAHDEALLVVVDKFGLDHILSRISAVSPFESVCDYVSDRDLLRRVIEICTTLESGKWNGKGSTEIVEDEGELDTKAISALQKAAIVAAAAALDSSGSGRSTPKAGSSKRPEASRRRGGKESSADSGRGAKSRQSAANSSAALDKLEKEKMLTLMQKGLLDSKMDLANMNPSHLFSLLGMASTPTSSSAAQFSSASSSQTQSSLQQIQQLQALMAMSSMFGGGSAALNNLSANALSCALGGMLPTTSTAPKEKAPRGGGVLNLSDAKKEPSTTSTPKSTARPADPSSLGSSLSSGLSASAVDRLNQMSAAELLALSDLPADTPIPVMHLIDGTRLAGEKAPKLRNLDEWLGANQHYTVDVMTLADAYSPSTPLSKTSAVGSVKREARGGERKASGVLASDSGGKGATETASISEKRSERDQPSRSKASSSGEAMDAAAAACRASAESLAQLENSVIIGVFRRSNGVALPSDEWPNVKNLLSWLDRNPDCNVQSTYANIKAMLPKSYHSRVGGEQAASTSSSQLDASALLPMADSSDLFTQLLASTMNVNPASVVAPTSAPSKAAGSTQPASTQQQSSTTAASSLLPNTMEALQMQLMLQQAMLGSSLYNPYMSLLAGGSAGGLNSSMLPSASTLNPNDLTAAFTSLLSSATATSTSAPSAAASSSKTKSTSSAGQLSDALGAELAALKSTQAAADMMSNPALLASMLGIGNSMASLFPGATAESLAGLGLDPTIMLSGLGDASALWLAAQMPTAGGAAASDTSGGTSGAADAAKTEKAIPPPTSQPKRATASSSKGRLNQVLEKLSSNNNSSANSSAKTAK